MELTEDNIKAIKDAARTIDYGSITLHFAETNNFIDIEIKKRIRVAKQSNTGEKPFQDIREDT